MRKEDLQMKNDKNYVFIDSDNLFICERLKEVDSSYRVVFNLKKNFFEVHCDEQYENTYCFTLPFPVLDERAISFALKTRRQNLDKLIAEIDRQNEQLYNKMVKSEVNKLKEALC